MNRTVKPTKSVSPTASTTERPLTARAVAELCGVELKTVHNWVLDGRLAHFRTPGRHLRFQPEVVAAFLSECGYAKPGSRPMPRVVCTAAARHARGFRQALADRDCTWVRDAWQALIELGASGAEAWVVDSAAVPVTELRAAVSAVRRRLPRVKVIVVAERPGTLRAGVASVRLDELATHLG